MSPQSCGFWYKHEFHYTKFSSLYKSFLIKYIRFLPLSAWQQKITHIRLLLLYLHCPEHRSFNPPHTHTHSLCPQGCPATAAVVRTIIWEMICTTAVIIMYADNKPRTLAALISSSATHSAIVLMFLKAASRAPVHSNQMACKQYHHSSLTAIPNLRLTPLAYHISNNIHLPYIVSYSTWSPTHACHMSEQTNNYVQSLNSQIYCIQGTVKFHFLKYGICGG